MYFLIKNYYFLSALSKVMTYDYIQLERIIIIINYPHLHATTKMILINLRFNNTIQEREINLLSL